ncbi:hypothetical protein UNDYM_0546 [Undibacterium sp. YM2]|nr:hypothetical protein UNDYM_0546 [Undibacterium sp. YM2]
MPVTVNLRQLLCRLLFQCQWPYPALPVHPERLALPVPLAQQAHLPL